VLHMLFFVLNHAGQLHVISLRWRETNVQEKKGKKLNTQHARITLSKKHLLTHQQIWISLIIGARLSRWFGFKSLCPILLLEWYLFISIIRTKNSEMTNIAFVHIYWISRIEIDSKIDTDSIPPHLGSQWAHTHKEYSR